MENKIYQPIPPEFQKSKLFRSLEQTALSSGVSTSRKIEMINMFSEELENPSISPEEKEELMELLKEGQFNFIENLMTREGFGFIDDLDLESEENLGEVLFPDNTYDMPKTYTGMIELSLELDLLTEQRAINLIELLERIRKECFANIYEFIEKRQLSELTADLKKQDLHPYHFLSKVFTNYQNPSSYKKISRCLSRTKR